MEWIILHGLALVGGGWYLSMRARERAVDMVRAQCLGMGATLLDDTVSLVSLRLKRDESDRLRLRRIYHFQYSFNHNRRLDGNMTFMGERLIDFQVEDVLREM